MPNDNDYSSRTNARSKIITVRLPHDLHKWYMEEVRDGCFDNLSCGIIGALRFYQLVTEKKRGNIPDRLIPGKDTR